ncbi:MAG TPA: HU family DNA-binding protein [Candidatus Hydrothermia bacterium]|nr:HU family DNA-binding protein [Candidatus Hydrothermae bacterium]MDD3649037.1 HU family DNA-binding protein [Candidatus Hydrothermia bacterium]MDD5573271.1 HU family DNA-binding protein [Candidatus Hydrothermia bacterium]MDD5573385.1 HU family DNA-binding protein [Candidatus Hydrothermia bacterium]HOK22976.1 HU family DNA-binding protein [Candidatus Hydrothermia bacterium]
MNKQEVITKVAEKAGVTKKDATLVVNAFVDVVKESLAKKNPVRLIGFGTFDVRKRAERKGRNPRSKQEIRIPARIVPVFRASSTLKELVNKK